MNNIFIQQSSIREIFESGLDFEYRDNKPTEFTENNIKRIIVNSIRHNYSNYDYGLREIHKLSEIEYFKYKNITLYFISQRYPFLVDECNKQKHIVNLCTII